MGIEFRYKGRKVQPGQLGRELTRDLEASAREMVTRRVRGVICPVHLTAQTVSGTGDDMKVTGCCEEGIAAVKKALAGS